MSDENQLITPPAFTALYVAPGQIKPSLPRDELYRRYEFCEDLSTVLSDNAREVLFDLSIAETDVLERFYQGLLAPESGVSRTEAAWIIRRLCEHLNWDPALADPFLDAESQSPD
ncbi:MAG: ATPase with chaperone activity [Burkholderiaceae bacterium]